MHDRERAMIRAEVSVGVKPAATCIALRVASRPAALPSRREHEQHVVSEHAMYSIAR